MGNSDQHLVTIPQVFYDIIARVLPGCLFLFVLRFEFSAANLRFARIIGSPNGSLGSSIVNGIGYLVLCYFVGWLLKPFTIWSLELKGNEERELRDKLQRVRLKNETVGFRITKLRAEARMLETSRTGMCIIFIILTLVFFVSHVFPKTAELLPDMFYHLSYLGWICKFIVLTILAVGFRRCEGPAWRRYYGSISVCYELLFESNSPD